MNMKEYNRDSEKALMLYEKWSGKTGAATLLPGAGSDRKYYRIVSEDGGSVIATVGDDVAENRAFFSLAKAFGAEGCSVPEVFVIAESGEAYLQEDLGGVQLLDLLFSENRLRMSEKALEALVGIQTVDEKVWASKVMWPAFSKRLVMWDLNYFKYEFLKPAGIAFDEELLEDDFERMARELCGNDDSLLGFMYRDFQSRNIMIKEGKPYLIDFQGGRKGPLVYDVVSFLWQAKASFSNEEREALLKVYARLLSAGRGVTEERILGEVDKFALFRTLQVLGAYGFRGLIERKAHFIESIPGALNNLRELIDRGVLKPYPELERVAENCCNSRFSHKESHEGLTLKVFSFSYKKGYPEDLTGNGGGFMFDCRGMHNPGRYEEYKPLTGLDEEVVAFLEEKGEVQEFVKQAADLVSPTVARYLQRGFSSLQAGFGCTGGRHRSVYCAQHFAEEMKRRFPALRIELIHREQQIRETM